MNSITSLILKNKKVLIRVDFNVPIKSAQIVSDFRILASLETIRYCIDNGASVILMSHLGRPNGENNSDLSLKPIADYLSKYLNKNIYFSNNSISNAAIKKSNELRPGEVHLLENLRFYREERLNDKLFAHKLSSHGDVYINDAFGTAHRSHASNSSILEFFKDKAIGFLIEKEMKSLSNRSNVDNCLLLGGAKISTKLAMIKNYLDKTSSILIGGGMAFTFLKAKGFEIGKSLLEEDMINEALNILNIAKNSKVKVLLPLDVVCSKEFSNSSDNRIKSVSNISINEIGLDIGPKTIQLFSEELKNLKSVIWNGPMGAFEFDNFSIGTEILANCISKLTIDNKLISIIGGGDTASAVIDMGLENNFTHISTGGGASLHLLSGKKLELFSSWEKYE